MSICFWDEKPVCIILAAGKGTRLQGIEIPKCLIKYKGKTLLDHHIERWKDKCIEIAVVVGHKKEEITPHLQKHRPKLNIRQFVQTEQKGIAHALIEPLKFYGDRHYIVVLGDCYTEGKFNFPQKMKNGLGVKMWKNEAEIRQSYSVSYNDRINQIVRVQEKPSIITRSHLLGLGYYFFYDNLLIPILNTKLYGAYHSHDEDIGYIRMGNKFFFINEVLISKINDSKLVEHKSIDEFFNDCYDKHRLEKLYNHFFTFLFNFSIFRYISVYPQSKQTFASNSLTGSEKNPCFFDLYPKKPLPILPLSTFSLSHLGHLSFDNLLFLHNLLNY